MLNYVYLPTEKQEMHRHGPKWRQNVEYSNRYNYKKSNKPLKKRKTITSR